MIEYIFQQSAQRMAEEEAEEQRKAEQWQEADRARVEELEAKRLERLTREVYESLSPKERAEFDREHGDLANIKRAVEQARREADEHWTQADRERQHNELLEWRKTQSIIGSKDEYGKIFELSEAGNKRAQERLEARKRRDLESELESNDLERLWATLDPDERKIAGRILQEQPSRLEKIQKFVAERGENPIKNIDDPQTLYRMATEKPQRERWVEPLSNIENVDSPAMLYRMAEKQAEQKRS